MLLQGRIQRKPRAIKKAGHIDPAIYNKIYPTSDATPRFYAIPTIHKDPIKMKSIVSRLTPSYSARHLADLL